MIHASTNFSHAVAFEKRNSHQLVTDGIYAYVLSFTPNYQGLTCGKLVPSSFVRWILLLGSWDAAGSAKPAVFHPVFLASLEILLLPYKRCVHEQHR